MQRRDFLKYSVALGVASALPLWSRAVFAAERPTLPIPDLLTTDARNRIQLTIGAGQSTFGGKTATTWGYNGNLLGPAVKLQRGKAVTVDIYNQLTEETTLHWHGLEVPGEVDGGPQGIIPPGGKRSVSKSGAGGRGPLTPLPLPAGSIHINMARPDVRWRWGWLVWW